MDAPPVKRVRTYLHLRQYVPAAKQICMHSHAGEADVRAP
jgi:hypothetical protein